MTSRMDKARAGGALLVHDWPETALHRPPSLPHAYRCSGCGAEVQLAGRDTLPEGWRIRRRYNHRGVSWAFEGILAKIPVDYYCPGCPA